MHSTKILGDVLMQLCLFKYNITPFQYLMKYKFIYNQHIYIVHHLAFIFALEPFAIAFWDILLMYTCDFGQIRAY